MRNKMNSLHSCVYIYICENKYNHYKQICMHLEYTDIFYYIHFNMIKII